MEQAKEINATLKARDFHNKVVKIAHGDGSKFEFKYAFMKEIIVEDEKFICVFSEHHGVWTWHIEDLEKWD